MMDASTVKKLIEEMVPFAQKAGLVAEELTPTKVRIRLPHEPSNLNPMGTLHAGAIFTAAETAAGALCVMAFAGGAMVLAKSAEIRYRRPAKTDLIATAQLTPVDAQRILDGVTQEGKQDAIIAVELTDTSGEPISSATVTLSARRM